MAEEIKNEIKSLLKESNEIFKKDSTKNEKLKCLDKCEIAYQK